MLSAAILGGYTTDPVANAFRFAACGEGVRVNLYEAPFRAFREEILNPGSVLYREPRDLVLLAVHARTVEPWPAAADPADEVERVIDRHAEDMQRLWALLKERLGCRVWQHTLEPTGRRYIGPAEDRWPASPDSFIARLDRRLRDTAPTFVSWVDTASVAHRVGLQSWFDPRLYYHGKFGFNPKHLDAYAGLLSGLLRAMSGSARKVLVVDLDNTLWGGVIGDDGLGGIQLGNGSEVGEAHADFCAYVRDLGRRGVTLAVCSKNDPAIAGEVFERHPGMPLKRADFAAFHCGWEDKVGGLRTIAADLNLSLDHMVFADDNPVECEWVRRELPMVAVVELSGDPSGFIGHVERGHWFDAVRVTDEDLLRAASYQGRREAEQAKSSAADLPAHLRSLEMWAACARATDDDVPRLAQMEAKTNQFNVTTRRYDEAVMRELVARPDAVVLACRMRDRFADHGLVASMTVRIEGPVWRIDSWLMSCRVFSRTLEHFMFARVLDMARAAGAGSLVGEFVPTQRNGVVADLYRSLGFAEDPAGGGIRWLLDVGSAVVPETYVSE